MMLFWILLYLSVTVAIGIYTSRFVKTSGDFILAGRRLPFSMATATVFATWFGSETILGASAEFANNGMQGVIEEPFGAALCLVLVGLFFAAPLYRKNYTTFGDFYREHFGKTAEMVSAVFIILSYFGWIAAQMVAMGTVLHMVTGISMEAAIGGTMVVVTFYTWMGGLWAISVTDSLQMLVIVAGLFLAVWFAIPAEGIQATFQNLPEGYLDFFPQASVSGWIHWSAALLTLGLGSIPQQDVFQRVMASRSERIAVASSITAGVLYLTVALLPLYLGLLARQYSPGSLASQSMLLDIVMQKSPFVIQVLFLGALLSAILSTASGAILAPSSILSENIIKPMLHRRISDKLFLQINRYAVAGIALVSLAMALYRRNIYDLVSEASAISLVSLFVPLVAGLFGKSRNSLAAILSMLAGISGWLYGMHYIAGFPEIYTGLASSAVGYAAGLFFGRYRKRFFR